MRVKSYVVCYILTLTAMFVASAGFCHYMNQINMLPEGFIVSGGVIGFVTLMYAFFIAGQFYTQRMNAFSVGDVLYMTECVGHVGNKRGCHCMLVVCKEGIIVDDKFDGCKVIVYSDLYNYKVYPSEIRFCSEHVVYRFVFDRKLRAKAVQTAIASRTCNVL